MDRLAWLPGALATTLVVVAVSETMYYPTTVGPWSLVPWYLPAVVLALRLLDGRRGWPAVALAGWVVGVAVEGAVVAVLYEALPLSIVNPALGWHMLVSVLVGTLALGAALRSPSAWSTPAVASALGVLLGAWWPIWLVDGPLDAGDVGAALSLGAIALATGHAVLLVAPAVTPPRWAAVLAGVFVGASVVGQTAAFVLAPVVFIAVLAVPVRGLTRGAARPDGLPDPATDRRRAWRVVWLVLVPAVGTATHAAVVGALGESGAGVVAELLGLAQVVLGTVVAVAATVLVLRRDVVA